MNEVAVNDQAMTSGRGQPGQFQAEANMLRFVQKFVLSQVGLLGSLSAIVLSLFAAGAQAQSFRVQCPTSTITHPDQTNAGVNNSEPAYTGPSYTGTSSDY